MSFLPANADQIYVNILGGGAAVSIAHYLLTFSSVRGNVPLHFNFHGEPGNFARKRYYITYPVVTSLTCGLGYALRDNGTIKVCPADQPALCGVIVSSVFLLVAAQITAERVSNGKARKIPPVVLALGLIGLGSCAVYSVANCIMNK